MSERTADTPERALARPDEFEPLHVGPLEVWPPVVASIPDTAIGEVLIRHIALNLSKLLGLYILQGLLDQGFGFGIQG